MTREDLQTLRTPIISFALVVVASLAIVYYSGSVAESAHRRLQQEETRLRDARTRIQNAGEEKEMIGRYLAQYRQLEQAGFVGEEQRINWLDALRTANQQANIYGVEYEISAQRPYTYATELQSGGLLLRESVMRLKLRLLHEEDLPRFLQALARQAGGYFAVDECTLTRNRPGTVDPTKGAQANLLAECSLSWLTARPPTAADKKG
jgi:hypothetical protein